MNRLIESQNETDFIQMLKKEMLETLKDKQSLYNFDFESETIKEGRYVWKKDQSLLE